jgi:ABC-type cobalamin transport system ATPase subunit
VSKDFGYFKIGEVNHTVKYADNLELLAKETLVLQGRTDRLIKTERCFGIKNKCGKKTMVMRI